MHLSSNLSHWVCLLAGLYLILTSLMLRDIVADRAPALTSPAGHRDGRRRMLGLGRRAVMIGVGLLAVAYGISRIVL